MSKPVNFNTILLFIVSGVIGWIGVTTFNSAKDLAVISSAVVRLEDSVKGVVSQREYSADMERLRVEIAAWRTRMSKIEAEQTKIEAQQARLDTELVKIKQSLNE